MFNRFTGDHSESLAKSEGGAGPGCWRRFDDKYIKPLFGGDMKKRRLTLLSMGIDVDKVDYKKLFSEEDKKRAE